MRLKKFTTSEITLSPGNTEETKHTRQFRPRRSTLWAPYNTIEHNRSIEQTVCNIKSVFERLPCKVRQQLVIPYNSPCKYSTLAHQHTYSIPHKCTCRRHQGNTTEALTSIKHEYHQRLDIRDNQQVKDLNQHAPSTTNVITDRQAVCEKTACNVSLHQDVITQIPAWKNTVIPDTGLISHKTQHLNKTTPISYSNRML